jgi:anti-sigma regulatory factor (Ser/Thr protein kinase)/CheY-like chemotaxis protein
MLTKLRRVLVIAGEEAQAAELVSKIRSTTVLAGTEIVICSGGVEALQQLRQSPFDVLVTDPATPLREDLALVKELSAARPGLKPIVLAPVAVPDDVIAALRAHVFACFSAPFDFGEIADMIASAFQADDWREGIEVLSGEPFWITLRMSCRLLNAERLIQFMREQRKDVPEDDRERLMAAFREMLLNAMEHGAGFDPNKVIEVTAARTARAIVYHFRDPGGGFDRPTLASAQKATSPQEMIDEIQRRAELGLRPGGFGVLIAKAIVDELVYNERGNEVILIKHTQ